MGAMPLKVTEYDAGAHAVVLGPDSLLQLQHVLAGLSGHYFILGDTNTLRHCLPELLAHVPALRSAGTIAVEAGEASKDIAVCSDIWHHLIAHAADRQTILVNLGGGVVTDLGGFIAATYKRGIRCIHVPTSLMGMVDASIGGKTGIDLAGVKNVVGSFHDPLAVHIHVPFLKSLGKRELLNGLAEMLKHGLVRDAAHWQAITTAPLHDIEALGPLVERSAAIKAEVVRLDPREKDLRKVLNFGHTIGHAIEAHSWEGGMRPLLHGEAVAAGMLCATFLSQQMGLLEAEVAERITQQLLALYKPYPLAVTDHHRIIELMRNDKKNAQGEFRFTLLTGIGSATVDVPVSAAQVQDALEHMRTIAQPES